MMTKATACLVLIKEARTTRRATMGSVLRTLRALRILGLSVKEQQDVMVELDLVAPLTFKPYCDPTLLIW